MNKQYTDDFDKIETKPKPSLAEAFKKAPAAVSASVPGVETLPAVWRAMDVDIEELVVSSTPILQKTYPRIDPMQLANFVRMAMGMNVFRVLRTSGAWIIMEVKRTFLEPEPVIYELLLCSMNGDARDLKALEREMHSWGKQLKAVGFAKTAITLEVQNV